MNHDLRQRSRFWSTVAIIAVACWALPNSVFGALIAFNFTANGPSEAPPNASLGTGTGTITFDTVLNTMRVQANFSGLTGNVTNAHIHAATAVPFTGTAGVATMQPTFTGFPAGGTSGNYDQTFDMTLAGSFNAAYITANGGTPASALAALQTSAVAGTAYFNIHSTSFGGGEIRGFLVAVPEPSSIILSGMALAGIAVRFRKKRKAVTTE